MDAKELKQMEIGDTAHSDLDQTTYVIRTDHGFAVCDNGEEVAVDTAEQAVTLVLENGQAYADAYNRQA